MKFIPKTTSSERWEKVEVGEDSFEILVRSPTFDESMADLGIVAFGRFDDDYAADRVKHRMKCSIIDWRGIVTDGEQNGDTIPLEFTWDNLQAVCVQKPEFSYWIFLHANRAFEGTTPTKDEVGNSQPPSSDTVADGGEKTNTPDSISATT